MTPAEESVRSVPKLAEITEIALGPALTEIARPMRMTALISMSPVFPEDKRFFLELSPLFFIALKEWIDLL